MAPNRRIFQESESEETFMEQWHEIVGFLSFKIYKMQTFWYDIYPSNDNRWTSTTTNSTFCLTYLSSRAPQPPPVTMSTTSASLLSVSVSNNNRSIRATRTNGLAISQANVQDPPRDGRNYQPKKVGLHLFRFFFLNNQLIKKNKSRKSRQ